MAIVQEMPTARVELQVRREQLKLIEDAAFASGQSVNDFLAAAFVRLSQDILAREPLISSGVERPRLLTDRDRDIILALMEDDDQEPNEALKAAAKDYRRKLADGSLQTC